jgi:quinol monooxygenase YgiN
MRAWHRRANGTFSVVMQQRAVRQLGRWSLACQPLRFSKKIFNVAIRFHPSGRPWCVRNRRRHAMPDESVILINLLKVKPGKQDALIALLKQNTDTVVRTLHGWKTTRLIAAKDGAGVVIYSEWETPAAVEAMRSDPRMKAYFPKIIELASLDSIVGSAVLSETR